MNPKTTLLCCLGVGLALCLGGCSTVGPLCRSDEEVRASILKRTPLGCSSDQVYALIREQRWPIHSESRDKGFMMRRPAQNEAHSIEVGTRFVACELGT